MIHILVWVVLNGLVTQVPIEKTILPRETLYGEFGDKAILYVYNLSWGVRRWDIYIFHKKEINNYQRLYQVVQKDPEYIDVKTGPTEEFIHFPTLIRMGGSCKVAEGDVVVTRKLKEFSDEFVGKLVNPFE